MLMGMDSGYAQGHDQAEGGSVAAQSSISDPSPVPFPIVPSRVTHPSTDTPMLESAGIGEVGEGACHVLRGWCWDQCFERVVKGVGQVVQSLPRHMRGVPSCSVLR